MSRKTHTILFGILLIQTVLIAFLYKPVNEHAIAEIDLLADVTAADIVSAVISDSDGGKISLVRTEHNWQVAKENTVYPGDKKHIADFLSNLTTLRSDRLVTQTKASHSRLKVADQLFERKLTLRDRKNGEHILLIGSSPASNVIHGRNSNSEKVFLVKGISSWELNTDADLWWERRYVNKNIDELQSVELSNSHGSFTLSRKDKSEPWKLQGDNETLLSAEAVQEFLQRVSLINLTSYLGRENGNYGLEQPVAILTLIAENEPVTIKFAAGTGEEKSYVAKSSASPYFVEMTKYAVGAVLDSDKESLFEKR